MEIPLDKEPSEGEVLLFTTGGGFLVKGTMLEVAQKLAAEEWCQLELAESEDKVILQATHVVGIRGSAQKHRKGSIGFVHRD